MLKNVCRENETSPGDYDGKNWFGPHESGGQIQPVIGGSPFVLVTKGGHKEVELHVCKHCSCTYGVKVDVGS